MSLVTNKPTEHTYNQSTIKLYAPPTRAFNRSLKITDSTEKQMPLEPDIYAIKPDNSLTLISNSIKTMDNINQQLSDSTQTIGAINTKKRVEDNNEITEIQPFIANKNNEKQNNQEQKQLDISKILRKAISFTSSDSKSITKASKVLADNPRDIINDIDSPEDFIADVIDNATNDVTNFPLEQFSDYTALGLLPGFLIEVVLTAFNQGLKVKKIIDRMHPFAMVPKIKKHINNLNNNNETDRVVSKDEFNYLCNLIYLDPPNDYIETSKISKQNKCIMKLLHLDKKEVCISTILELLYDIHSIFAGGHPSKKNHEHMQSLLDIAGILVKKKSDKNYDLKHDHKLMHAIKKTVQPYGIKIKFDSLSKLEDIEKPDTMLIKIKKNDFYQKLKKSKKLPDIQILKDVFEANKEHFDVLYEKLANYDNPKKKENIISLIILSTAIPVALIPGFPGSDILKASNYLYGVSKHKKHDKQADKNANAALNLLDKNQKPEDTPLIESIQNSLDLKKRHHKIKKKHDTKQAITHAVSALLSLPLSTLGTIGSLMKSIVKILTKLTITFEAAIQRHNYDDKKRSEGSFVKLQDVFSIIQKNYAAAIENNDQEQQDFLKELTYLLFNIKPDVFDKLIESDLVLSDKFKLSYNHEIPAIS